MTALSINRNYSVKTMITNELLYVSDIDVGDIKTKQYCLNSQAVWYVYKTDNGAVFLSRKDMVIKRFTSYHEGILFAEKNMHLI